MTRQFKTIGEPQHKHNWNECPKCGKKFIEIGNHEKNPSTYEIKPDCKHFPDDMKIITL